MPVNNNTSINPVVEGQTPVNTDLATGQTPTTPQQPTPSGSKQTPISELPIDTQDYIKRLRDEANKANKALEAEATAKKKAEEARLIAQGEFQKLAEKHAARVQELEPLQGRFETLSTLITGQIEAQIKDWPAEVKTFDPGVDASVEQRLAWVEKSKPLIEKLQQQAQSGRPGNAPNPKPSTQSPEGVQSDYTKKLFNSNRYPRF